MTRKPLTERRLDEAMEEHRRECDDCAIEPCARARRIEGSFWDEVDRRIDEADEPRDER